MHTYLRALLTYSKIPIQQEPSSQRAEKHIQLEPLSELDQQTHLGGIIIIRTGLFVAGATSFHAATHHGTTATRSILITSGKLPDVAVWKTLVASSWG